MTSTPNPTAQRQRQKADLRRRLLKARQAIPPRQRQSKGDRLCGHLQRWPQFHQARCILSYCSFRGEPDLSPLMSALGNRQRQWGLPRCQGSDLVWHQWLGPGTLVAGTYGILEPAPTAPLIDPRQVDLMLVPGIACDVQGYRLGYGGGFYDRLLSQPQWRAIPTIAIVFEYARLPTLPRDPWDLPLGGVCTEAGLFLRQG